MKIILTGLLLFYVLILITRYAGPILLRYFLKRMGKKFGMNYEAPNQKEKNVFSIKKEQKKSSKKVGEYIDFEEID